MQDDRNNSAVYFEKYKIIDCLKKDEYSCVYIADHVYLGKKILLKTLKTEGIPDTLWLDRFKREAKILARLDHPNIIKVLDFGRDKNTFYISFEYFQSRNLRDVMIGNSLNTDQKREILIQLLQGVAAAHLAGVVHRDIKPENILIDDTYHLKIADFGLAIIMNESVLTSKSSIVGTPCYMSPEQIKGESLSQQSDVFSLGIVAYELFCGENPFLGNDINATINNILNYNESKIFHSLSDIPSDIAHAIEKMLQKNIVNRPESAREILQLLKVASEEQKPWRMQKKIASKLTLLATSLAVLVFIYFALITLQKKDSADIVKSNQSSQDIIPPKPDYNRAASIDTQISEYEVAQKEVSNENMVIPQVKKSQLPGKVLVKSVPQAKILIDSQFVGITPLSDPFELSAGDHILEWVHKDYPTYQRSIQIQSGQVTFVRLNPDSLFGYLNCYIYPWGEVYIDESRVGQSPFHQPLIIPAGMHKLVLYNPGFTTFIDTVTIVSNETTNYRINLEQVSKMVHLDSIK